jgi:hypothetical protein
VDADPLGDRRPARAGDGNLLRRESRVEPAVEHRAGHVAAAEQVEWAWEEEVDHGRRSSA